MAPYFIVCDFSAQRFPVTIVVAINETPANLKTFALMLCSKLFWHPFCTDFTEPDLIVDDLLGRAWTNPHKPNYLTDDNKPAHHYRPSSLLNLLVRGESW